MFNEEEPANIRQHFALEDDGDYSSMNDNTQVIDNEPRVAVVDFVNADDHQIAEQQTTDVNRQVTVVPTEETISYEPQNVQMFSLHDDIEEEHTEDEIIVHGQEKTQLDEMLEFEKSAEQDAAPKSTIEKIKKYFKDEFQFKSRKLNVFYASHFLASWVSERV